VDGDLDRALARLPLPAALRKPIVTSLHDDPARRHPDAAGWLADIEAALTPPAPPPPTGAAAPERPSGARRRAAVGGVALVVAGAVAGAVAMNVAGAVAMNVAGDGGDDGADQVVTRRENGDVEVSDRAGDASIAVVGPARADVGTTVTFTAEVDGVDHWAWLMPDGAVYADRSSVQLGTRSAGVAEVTLVAVAASGEQLEVRHELRLVEP
jgi:hypothetical protein